MSSHSSTVVIDFCLGSIVFPVRWGLFDVSSHSSWYIMLVPGFEFFGRSAYAAQLTGRGSRLVSSEWAGIDAVKCLAPARAARRDPGARGAGRAQGGARRALAMRSVENEEI